MKQNMAKRRWGPGMFFETEEGLLRHEEDERRRAERQLVNDEPKPQAKKMDLVSLSDLLAEPEEEVDWIVEGLLPKGGLSVIVAKPKTGKSTVARQLALCVARGESFLSRETARGLAIYLALEERRGDVRSHFRKMGTTGEERLEIFVGIAPQDAIAQVREIALVEKPALIVVDTLARLARIKDLNDYSQTTSGLEPILAIAREAGAHVCLLHHAKKGDGKGIDSILGSTGIAGTVDTIIQLHRTDKYRTISSMQRVGEDIEETVLDFDSDRRWSSMGESREQTDIDRAKEAILDFLAEHEEPVEEKEIDEGGEGRGRRSHRKKALRQLVSEGEVTRTGEGKKGKPYRYQNAGILVPTIFREPENQKSENDVTPQNTSHDSGSRNQTIRDSGSHADTPELWDAETMEKFPDTFSKRLPAPPSSDDEYLPEPDLPEGF